VDCVAVHGGCGWVKNLSPVTRYCTFIKLNSVGSFFWRVIPRAAAAYLASDAQYRSFVIVFPVPSGMWGLIYYIDKNYIRVHTSLCKHLGGGRGF
jgi:hypothetical protein